MISMDEKEDPYLKDRRWHSPLQRDTVSCFSSDSIITWAEGGRLDETGIVRDP